MAARLIWSPKAVNQFEAICDYISLDSSLYASIFARQVNQLVKAILRFPHSGRIVPEYRDPNLREKLYGNYRIVYRVKGERVEVVAICHGARLFGNVIE